MSSSLTAVSYSTNREPIRGLGFDTLRYSTGVHLPRWGLSHYKTKSQKRLAPIALAWELQLGAQRRSRSRFGQLTRVGGWLNKDDAYMDSVMKRHELMCVALFKNSLEGGVLLEECDARDGLSSFYLYERKTKISRNNQLKNDGHKSVVF